MCGTRDFLWVFRHMLDRKVCRRKGNNMGKFTPLDFEEYVALARQAAAEGCVLLKNDNEALPLRKGDKVAVFGRIAFHYYKSGLGSGGLVNTKYVVGILDALKEEKTSRSMRIFLEHMRNGSRKIHTTKARAGEKCRGPRKRWSSPTRLWRAQKAPMQLLLL